MKIFIGSSRESLATVKLLRKWLGRRDVLAWEDPGAFKPDRTFFDELLLISRNTDGAVFVFAEDDVVESRKDASWATRDNVLLEYGLFVGTLGRDQVRRVVIGNPKIPSDLLGVVAIKLPKAAEAKLAIGKRKLARAKAELTQWKQQLPPAHLKELTFDVGHYLTGHEKMDVKTILTSCAPGFLMEKSVTRIRALCSEKGKFSRSYYQGQFDWVKQGQDRSIRRIFVAKKRRGSGREFSQNEARGILMHWNQRNPAIRIKWVFEENKWLGALYRDALGFALFDEKWILHWGLKHGYRYVKPEDKLVGKLFARHFEDLWRHSEPFTEEVISRIRSKFRHH